MREFVILFFALTIGSVVEADIHKNDDLIPSNILFKLTTKTSSETDTKSPIEDSIKLYQNLTDIQANSADIFIDPLNQALRTFKERIQTSEKKNASNDNRRKASTKRKIDSIKMGVALLKEWALDDTVSGRARIFRVIYATAKVEEISKFIDKENQGWGFFIQGSLWRRLNVKFPCEIWKEHPNESIDGLLSSIFDFEGKYKHRDSLARIINSPFSCPSTEFHKVNFRDKPNLGDYAAMHSHLNGKSLGDWYEKHSSTPLGNTEDAPKNLNFPEYNYQNTILNLEGSTKPNDILLMVLLKHTYGTTGDISESAKMLDGIKDQLESSHPANDFEPDHPYDGTDESMIKYLRHYSQNSLGGSAYFTIPCGVLIKNPKLLPAISPYYGSNRDNFLPRHDCDQDSYPLPNSVYDYLRLVDAPQNDWLSRHRGTLRYAHYKTLNNQNLMIKVFPRQLLGKLHKRTHKYPYETWSYLNIENRNTFEKLKAAYRAAKQDIKHHYVTNFALTEKEADEAAESALWVTVREIHWGSPPTSGLRYKILENYPYEEIAEEINSVDDLSKIEHSMISMDYYSGPWTYVGLPDPLLMMAVKRPNVLKLLISKKNTVAGKPYDYSRWQSLAYNNPDTYINARNKIGKTALHAAIQQNMLISTKLLVEAGADITAVVDGPLTHNKRTAAMYAAAGANLELVQYLLNKGVNFSVTDSKGVGPIGYLMGFGAFDMNPHLTKENFKQFVNLINPNLFSPSARNITPTYSCEKADNYAEKTVCSDTYISMLDRILSIHYKGLYFSAENKGAVKKSQIKWIKNRNECSTNFCVRNSYQKRIQELNG